MGDIDSAIIEKAASGDMEAFEQVYRTFSGFVYNVALRVTRNSPDAEEVTQDVFMKIFHELRQFQFRSAFKTWVYRITTNTAINYYRKTKRERKDRVDFEGVIDTVRSDYSTRDEVMRNDSESKIRALLEVLSPAHKMCLILREIEGLRYQEIAAILAIPVNTVRSRLKRARQALLEAAQRGLVEDEV
ncbi:MAG: sigma-70 family RNA polymerase sigma factor [Candidatus Omnitrophica bacterium]|nr:sigma-70 family RNA polymerase sigma factor [Candidatus Omnitrophota bacterium]